MRREAKARTCGGSSSGRVAPLAVCGLVIIALGASVVQLAACASDDTPDAKSGFVQQDPFDREIQGRVLYGNVVVPGATVYVEATVPSFLTDDDLRDAMAKDSGLPGVLTSTDVGGRYQVYNGPLSYDLWVKKDRDVAVFRGVGPRNFDPSLGTDAPVTGFSTTLSASTVPAPTAGHSVAYFVTGADARALTGSGGALTATFASFASTLTVYAAEYVTTGGLVAVTRSGHADVRVTSGVAASLVVPVDDVAPTFAGDVSFIPVVPPGFTLTTLDVIMDVGLRRDAQTIAHATPGVPVHISVVDGGRYCVRAIATNAGSISDSGLVVFNGLAKGPFEVILPPPSIDASFDGMRSFSAVIDEAPFTHDAGAMAGILEHVLVPQSPTGTTIRVITSDRLAVIPDVTLLGAMQPLGAYTWTVRSWPTLSRTVALSGDDVRSFTRSATTAPRVIELR